MGKTADRRRCSTPDRKHPHGRGEELHKPLRVLPCLETPPRAWGRVLFVVLYPRPPRNTPTGVGKSRSKNTFTSRFQKHPHGRGEEGNPVPELARFWETPPRAWGRGRAIQHDRLARRNTPTGVGKRPGGQNAQKTNWKHPHGRGEEYYAGAETKRTGETPPRAWGRVFCRRPPVRQGGNTPTGVGKRAHSNFKQFEYYSIFFSFVKEPGSVCADFSIISCSPIWTSKASSACLSRKCESEGPDGYF